MVERSSGRRAVVLSLSYSHDGSTTSGAPFEVQSSQINAVTVSRMFNLNPETIWLEQGQKVYFPDNTQDFHLNDVNEREAIIVRGVKVQTQARFEAGVAASSSISATGTPNRPIFTMKKPLESTVKITKASINRMSGRVGKEFEAQIFIDIREDTANVTYLNSMIQSKWGSKYVIVTSDGLPIEDCAATKGLKFWKVGSRKIYAVQKEETAASLEDSSDEERPLSKKKRSSLAHEIKNLRKEIVSVRSSGIPFELYMQMYDTFLCQICRASPAHPPIIFTNCCKRIVGCKTCVDEWYASGSMDLTIRCPLCRAESGSEDITEIKGLDDFLSAISPLLNPRHHPRSVDGSVDGLQ